MDTHGIVWTVWCAGERCTQTGRHILSTFGGVYAVNSHGNAVGYSRPNADGAGFDFVWLGGRMVPIELTPLAMNNAGEIAGWRPNYASHRVDVVLLEPRPPALTEDEVPGRAYAVD